jgi:hypothetical protein
MTPHPTQEGGTMSKASTAEGIIGQIEEDWRKDGHKGQSFVAYVVKECAKWDLLPELRIRWRDQGRHGDLEWGMMELAGML